MATATKKTAAKAASTKRTTKEPVATYAGDRYAQKADNPSDMVRFSMIMSKEHMELLRREEADTLVKVPDRVRQLIKLHCETLNKKK